MTYKGFEEYLYKQFEGDEPQVLDDDLTDAFEVWVLNLDNQELIDHADVFAMQMSKK